MIIEQFDKWDNPFDELTEKIRITRQRFTGLRRETRQPRLATGADVKPDSKTHKRTEDAVADRVMNGNSSTARRVYDGPTSLTSFGRIAESPALPFRDDVLVDKGAEAPKPCLSPVEMRTQTAAGGLLPAVTASIAMRTIFPRPLSFWTLGEETKERTNRTTLNQLSPRCWRKVLRTKPRQTLMFDLGGCSDCLRGCPFLGGRYALLSGRVCLYAALVSEARVFLIQA